MTQDNLIDLLNVLKQDNINYYLITLENIPHDGGTKINIFTSLEEQETKNLIKVVKGELKDKKDEN